LFLASIPSLFALETTTMITTRQEDLMCDRQEVVEYLTPAIQAMKRYLDKYPVDQINPADRLDPKDRTFRDDVFTLHNVVSGYQTCLEGLIV
jgi:hypothetical protein